jgi:hypothetical protein
LSQLRSTRELSSIKNGGYSINYRRANSVCEPDQTPTAGAKGFCEATTMKKCWLLLCLVALAPLSGCVLGYGPCLFLKPIKNTFTGRVHFREYPSADGVDNVPVLTLDSTAYVYSPAQSSHCLAANELQLEGFSEFPPDVIENTHVTVTGTVFGATAEHQHTPLLIDVVSVLPIKAAPKAENPGKP